MSSRRLRADYSIRLGEAVAFLSARIAPIYLQLLRQKLSTFHMKHVVQSNHLGQWCCEATFLDSSWSDSAYGGYRGYIERSYAVTRNRGIRFRVRHYLSADDVIRLALDLESKCDLCHRRLRSDGWSRGDVGLFELIPSMLLCRQCISGAYGEERAASLILKREAKKKTSGVVA